MIKIIEHRQMKKKSDIRCLDNKKKCGDPAGVGTRSLMLRSQ